MHSPALPCFVGTLTGEAVSEWNTSLRRSALRADPRTVGRSPGPSRMEPHPQWWTARGTVLRVGFGISPNSISANPPLFCTHSPFCFPGVVKTNPSLGSSWTLRLNVFIMSQFNPALFPALDITVLVVYHRLDNWSQVHL